MKIKVACIQMTSGADMAANIAGAAASVKKAATRGATLITLPENVFLMRAPGGGRVAIYKETDHPGVKAAIGWAKLYKVWVLVGSVAIDPSTRSEKRQYNRSLLIAPTGKVAARYDKIHLFDVEVGDGQTYNESARIVPGKKIVLSDLCLVPSNKEKLQGTNHKAPGTKLGLTICYDVRFPQLYRALAKAGASILTVPSAFTAVTGEAHWHTLLRARAIENTCFVIAPAQCGTHPGERKTYGHSLIIDPWGKVLADGGTKPGVVMAEIDLGQVERVRKSLPSLRHDRKFS